MRYIMCALLCFFTMACSNKGISQAQYNEKLKEIEIYKQEIARLKIEIDKLEHGAARELALAKKAMDGNYFKVAIEHAQSVISSHPETLEAKEALALINQAQTSMVAAKAKAEQELNQALAHMDKKYDKMRQLTVWRDSAMPKFVNSKSWIGSYIMAPENGAPYLRFVVYYVDSDWLFIERYLFDIDGKKFILTPAKYGPGSISTDNGDGDIWETFDILAEGDSLAILKALGVAKEATVRCEGKQYYKDRNISQAERTAIKNTLSAISFLTKAN